MFKGTNGASTGTNGALASLEGKKHLPGLFALATLAVALSTALGQITVPEYVYIDGSRLPGSTSALPEGYQIQPTDFAAWGVTVTMNDGLPGFPIVVSPGDPLVAFVGQGGSDSPLVPGSGRQSGITDPVGAGGDVTAFRPLRFGFDPPAAAVRVCMARDIDGNAPNFGYDYVGSDTGFFRNENPRFRERRRGLRSGVWDSPTAAIDFAHTGAGIGYAISDVIVYRLPQNGTVARTGPFVRVSQESAPGLGDFDAGVLGVVRPVRSPTGAAPFAQDVYAYERSVVTNSNSYGGLRQELGLASMQCTVYFADTVEGLTMFVVFSDGTNMVPAGTANMQVSFSGFPNPVTVTVDDDPSEVTTVDMSGKIVQASKAWDGGYTDGFAVSGANGNWQAIADIQSFSGGLLTWAATSTDGTPVALAMEAGRRVRFDAINTCIAVSSPPDSTACVGGVSVLHAAGRTTTSGGPITYAWRKNLLPINPVFNPSAVTDSLMLIDIQPSDAGSYDCIVTNACGSVTSNPATLTVLSPTDPACAGPTCDPDVNQDGVADQSDIDYLINAIAGGDNPTNVDPDFNHDGVADQTDVDAIIDVIAGGECP